MMGLRVDSFFIRLLAWVFSSLLSLTNCTLRHRSSVEFLTYQGLLVLVLAAYSGTSAVTMLQTYIRIHRT